MLTGLCDRDCTDDADDAGGGSRGPGLVLITTEWPPLSPKYLGSSLSFGRLGRSAWSKVTFRCAGGREDFRVLLFFPCGWLTDFLRLCRISRSGIHRIDFTVADSSALVGTARDEYPSSSFAAFLSLAALFSLRRFLSFEDELADTRVPRTVRLLSLSSSPSTSST